MFTVHEQCEEQELDGHWFLLVEIEGVLITGMRLAQRPWDAACYFVLYSLWLLA
jgi:hypothetical protein